MRTPRPLLVSALALGVTAALLPASTGTAVSAPDRTSPRTAYERAVLADNPRTMFRGRTEVFTGRVGRATGSPGRTSLPDGAPAVRFDGQRDKVSYGPRAKLGFSNRGVLTVEYWMRPDRLQFSDEEGSGYVYVLGKGSPGKHEWYGRMYSKENSESRPNRISGYAFNPEGGLGAGSYFQDRVRTGQWIHVVLVVNARRTSREFPQGYTKIYKNGRLRDQDSLADYDIVPRRSGGAFRIGTGYGGSHFHGAVGGVATYHKELGARRVRAHHRAMRG